MDKIKAEVCSALAGKASNREIFGGNEESRPEYNIMINYLISVVTHVINLFSGRCAL